MAFPRIPIRVVGSALVLGLVLGVAPAVSAQDSSFVADTRTHLARLEKLGFAGVVLVAHHGVPMLAQGYGLADRERDARWTPATVSTVGSITKQFTAAAILALEEAGRLRVSDSLPAHFPDVPADKRSITLHQLLTHSSGIGDLDGADDWDPIGREEFVRRALAQPLHFAPGSGYEYSNANYSLLGAVIEQMTGQSWEQYARARLFLPQGMYETGYVLPQWGEGRLAQGYRNGVRWGTVLERPMDRDGPWWALRANGGVHAPAWDMLRWAEALLGGRVLAPASMTKLWTPWVSEGGDTHYGYGWVVADVGGTRVLTHNGGNGIHFADLAIVPASHTVVFLQSNVIADTPVGQRLLEQIGARLLAQAPYPEVPDVIPVEPAALAAVAGRYALPGGTVAWRFSVSEGQLIGQADGPRAFTILHSTRSPDSTLAARLSALTDRIVDGATKGDFGPMRRARRDDVTEARLAQNHSAWVAEQEAALGKLAGHEVLGTALQDDRDMTVVRYRFERGVADRAYVWDRDAEARLLGVSFRGMRTSVQLVPTGPGAFATWDGGLTSSKPVTFMMGPGERMRVTVGALEGGISAVR